MEQGDKIKAKNGNIATITKIEDGEVTVDYPGKDCVIPSWQLEHEIEKGNFEIIPQA